MRSAVNIMGTFSKDRRPENGLEEIAEELLKDQVSPRIVVGVIVPHAVAGHKIGEPEVPVVRFAAIEVVDGEDATTVKTMLDQYRAKRHREPVQESIFDAEGWARDTKGS